MRKATTMGATDKVKANKRSSRVGSANFSNFVNDPKEQGNLRLPESERPTSSLASASAASSSLRIPESGTTITSTTPNASSTASEIPSPRRNSALKVTNYESSSGRPTSSENELKPKMQRAMSFVLVNNKPAAMFVRPKDKALEKEEEDMAAAEKEWSRLKPVNKPNIELPPVSKLPESMSKALRTFRVWAPHHQKKSIVVKIGNRNSKDFADEVFKTSQMKAKSYSEWRKEAKALLPSNTGGPPIEELTVALNAAPMLQRELDPRVIHRTIRRLSIESDGTPVGRPRPRKEKPAKVDYTKFREHNWDPSRKSNSTISFLNDDDKESGQNKKSNSDTVLDLGGDSDSEAERRLQEDWERHQAGTDIKGKMETLKYMADHLSSKRVVRQQLVQKATGQTVMDTEEIPIKEHILYLIEYLGNSLHDAFTCFIIWKKDIREINGRFGVVTANYFLWVRQMIGLEVIALVLTNAIIIIPEIVDQSQEPIRPNPKKFHLAHLVTGEGYFRHSYLYYIGYHNRNEDSANPLENPAFRFLFCMLVMFFVLTYFIFSRLTKYYHTARMESTVSGVANMETFKSTICGWDFSCRDPKGKIFLQKTICREMRILARKSRNPGTSALIQIQAEHKRLLAFAVKYLGVFWGPWALHIGGTLLIIITCVVLGVYLLHLCEFKKLYYLKCVSLRDDGIQRNLKDPVLCPNGDNYLATWILSFPAVFASMATLLLTKFILFIGDLESWNNPERKIYAAIIRAGLFYFTNIGVLYTFWLRAKPELNAEGFVAESIFGAELYRLVVIQGLMDVTLNLGVKGIYHLIRRTSKNYKKTEFRTEDCCLSMFFIHSVSRIGILFCPPLSIFVILRLVVDFYQHKFTLFYMSSHESYASHVSQVVGPFLLTFFILCYLITSFMNVYYITDTIPSNYDGPFEIYNKSYDEVLALLISSEKNTKWIQDLSGPAFLWTLLALLGAMVYFCHEWAVTYEPLIVQLNELINMERGDRDLLLKAIYEIGQVTGEDVADPKLTRIRRKSEFMIPSYTEMVSSEVPSSEVESEIEGEDDDADQQIEQLIHQVKRRKSVHMSHGLLQKASAEDHLDTTGLLPSKRVALNSMNEHSRNHHMQHMEAMVANIVHTRRKSMTLGNHPPLRPQHHP